MNPTATSSRLVSGIAVAAVCLAASASLWEARAPASGDNSRPAADAPVRVVKGPALAPAQRLPAGCTDCGSIPVQGGNL